MFIIARSTHPKMGTLDGALGSGRLGIVSSDDLRSVLASWPRIFAEFSEHEIAIEIATQAARSALYAAAPVASAILARLSGVGEVTVPMPADLVGFLTSQIGQNYAADRALSESRAFREGQTLLTAIDEVLALLEDKIE